MTHEEAISTAQGMAFRFGKPFVVYRLLEWPESVYGVIAEKALPDRAWCCEVLQPNLSTALAARQRGLW